MGPLSGTYAMHHRMRYLLSRVRPLPKGWEALSELDEWTDGKLGRMVAGGEVAHVDILGALARPRLPRRGRGQLLAV